MSDLVSVVIPVHNRAQLLPRAIDSALGQRDVEVEVIVVDDASTDGSAEAAAAVSDERVRLIRRPHRGGGSAARNTGIDAARGGVIAFLDSDDTWEPDKLASQLACLKSMPGTGLVLCGFLAIYPHGRRASAVPGVLRGNAAHRLLMLSGGPLTTSMFVVPAEVAGRVRFDESLPALQDYDFALQVVKLGFDINGPSSLMIRKFADTPGRVFTNENEIRARQLILVKYRDDIEQDPRRSARHHRALALALSRAGRHDEARVHLASARASSGDWVSRVLTRCAGSPRLLQRAVPVLTVMQDMDVARLLLRARDAVGARG